MKKKILFFLLLLITATLTAQTDYYYYNGKQMSLSVSKSKLNIFVNTSFDKNLLQTLGIISTDFVPTTLQTGEEWATITLPTAFTELEYLQLTNRLKNTVGVTGVAKHFQNGENNTTGTSNLFYVKLKSANDYPILQQLAIETNTAIHHQLAYQPLWYALCRKPNALMNSVALSNYFHETNHFSMVDPAFVFETRIPEPVDEPCLTSESETPPTCTTNDAILNWGQYNHGSPNIDINMCEAWNLSRGQNTKTAVIDTGIQLNHPDMAANISPFSYDATTNTSPSNVYGSHGSFVAGIIGAVKDNGTGLAGVAPETQLISISSSPTAPNLLQYLENQATGIGYAKFRQADVINNSWGVISASIFSNLLESVIIDAATDGRIGRGCIMVFAIGNEGNSGMRYPASNPNLPLLTVGAIRPDGLRATFSSRGAVLDVTGPGVCVNSADNNSSYMSDDGTSFAAPHVAGVAALMLSVNPCLSRQQVYDIIEQTSQKVGALAYATNGNRPNGTWNQETGYGLIDAYAATLLAQQMYNPNLDLFIKDDIADIGLQPNPATNVWNSPNIWVRNQQDNIQVHQTPISYNGTNPNFVYVKVKNKGCIETSGEEVVQLYQSTTSTYVNPDLPEMRRPNMPSYNTITNRLIGSVALPAGLKSGQEVILQFTWNVPLPPFLPTPGGIEAQGIGRQSYNLLAKIVTPADPLAVAETSIAYNNIKNNNNIAGKSVIVKDNSNALFEYNRIAVGNPFNEPKTYKLELVKENTETGKAIYEEAEVSIKMDEALFSAWERGGKQEQNLEQTADAKKQIVEANQVLIDNIQLNAFEEGFVNLSFNFLTQELTDKSQYKYHIIQRDKATNQIIGGVTYQINKEPRPIFEADAGNDKEKDRNETITISAQQISEPAIYNWYDSDGNLVFTGKDLTVATNVAEKFKLEVIATADGFKDYSEVEVKLKPSVLSIIAPNPATDNVTIGYKINEGGNAYLMILGGYGTNSASNNYIINPELGEININLANYSNGFYTVALIVNGSIIDAKTLIKE